MHNHENDRDVSRHHHHHQDNMVQFHNDDAYVLVNKILVVHVVSKLIDEIGLLLPRSEAFTHVGNIIVEDEEAVDWKHVSLERLALARHGASSLLE